MTRETVVRLIDDLDGSEGQETVRFGLDGRSYEIDLNASNAEGLREVLAPYVRHARRGGGNGRGRRGAPDTRRSDAARSHDIRTWAREHGYQVSDRGRIAKEIVEAYDAAR